MSELGIFLYNIGREEEGMNFFKILEENRWGVLSSSPYLEAKSANIHFTPKPDQRINFSGLFLY